MMFYYLSLLSESFGPFRLFEYVTFRAGGALFTSFLLVALFGGRFAALLRRWNMQAADRYKGLLPDELIDARKNRTPCMGGILLIGSILIAAICWSSIGNPIPQLLIGGTLAFALLGFADDFIKVFRQQRDGLSRSYKLAGEFIISCVIIAILITLKDTRLLMAELMVPFFKEPVFNSLYLTIPVAVIALVGVSNAVNFTDGKDGLASGCTILCTFTYAVFAYLMGHKIFAGYLNIPYIPGVEEAVVFSAAVCGGCIGFLWHNCYPAAMFMGDTGSLALGGAIGMLAVMLRQEILLLLIGIVFVMEIVSVVIQMISFRFFKRRVFLCTPIHHHFERLQWQETQIVVRFWIIAGMGALLALATLKLR